ncbi:glycoside-pentoside-hexuronide (GPH):cation symporter [Clostridiaceae bacterium M8S5]|nr:glycoside-pentoside-hexuronide (GPH):cation symporter [Clostridiaceae bacterium M8S5]
MSHKSMKQSFLTKRSERFSYGSWMMGQNIIYILVLIYLPMFYTDVVGLSTKAVATLFFISRIWDAINDPILGGLIDKTNPKKGKYLVWVKSVTFLLPILTIIVFMNIKGGSVFNLTYAYITYIIWGMVYTISDAPIFALVTTMTDNPNERNTLIAIGQFSTGIAGVFAGILLAPIIDSAGWTPAVLMVMVIAFVVMMPIRFTVKERVVAERKNKLTVKMLFTSIIKNKYLLVLYSGIIFKGALNLGLTVSTYFVKYNLGNLKLMGILSLTTILPLIVLPPILPRAIDKFGKITLMIGFLILAVATSIIQYCVGYNNFMLYFIISIFKGVGFLGPNIMKSMFVTDCIEYGEYVTGERNSGLAFSIQTFSAKFNTAISGSLTMVLLGVFGFNGLAEMQSQTTLDGIWLMTTLIPAIGALLCLIIFACFYKLKESDVRDMMKEMKERKLSS